jgi:predicted RNase H-like nuclease (RuvC/YqgF family)
MTSTIEALLPWISFLAAIGAVIALFAKMRAQVDRSLEKDKEQDAVIEKCASKEAIERFETRLDTFIAKYETKHEALVIKVNSHGEMLAGLRSTLDELRQSVDKLANKIDGLRNLT